MIGKRWQRPQRAIVLILDADGVQHGFEIDSPTIAGWELLDTVDADGRSHGRVSVEGAMYRMSIDPNEPMLQLQRPRPALDA